MRFQKGQSGNPAGKPKGKVSKVTSELKTMIMGALDKAGGEEYLTKQADKNPTAFMQLIGKYIPAELNAKFTGKVQVNGTVTYVRPEN